MHRERLRRALRHPRGETRPLRLGKLYMDPERYVCTWHGRVIELTAREFSLVWILAVQPEKIMTRKTLIDETYAGRASLSIRSVDSHISRVREKFKAVDRRFGAIDSVRHRGYRFMHT